MSTSRAGASPRQRRRSAGAVLTSVALLGGTVSIPTVLLAPAAGAAAAVAKCNSADGTVTKEVELPDSVDPSNYFCTYWGDVNGKPAVVFSPKLVEEGKPIPIAGSGFTNLAGTGGAKVGIKFAANTIYHDPALSKEVTGHLNKQQAYYVWDVVQAASDGSFSVGMDYPTTSNAKGLDKEPMTPGSPPHVLNVNAGSISDSGVDPAGASPLPAFQVIAAGTLQQELENYGYKPKAAPDPFAQGDPGALKVVGDGTIADGASSITATIPSLPKGTWVHLTPVGTDGSNTPTKLQGQWKQVDADGAATFETGDIAGGEYNVVVYTADSEGKTQMLGRIPWTHAGSSNGGDSGNSGATTKPTTTTSGPWFVGPPLTPWWTTSKAKSTAKATTPKVNTRATAAPAAGQGAGGGTATTSRTSTSTSRQMQVSVPTTGAAGTRSGASGTSSGPSKSSTSSSAGKTSSTAAKKATTKSTGTGTSTGAGTDADGDVDMLAGDGSVAEATGMDKNMLLMLAAAAVLLLIGAYASGLVVIGRFLGLRSGAAAAGGAAAGASTSTPVPASAQAPAGAPGGTARTELSDPDDFYGGATSPRKDR